MNTKSMTDESLGLKHVSTSFVFQLVLKKVIKIMIIIKQ